MYNSCHLGLFNVDLLEKKKQVKRKKGEYKKKEGRKKEKRQRRTMNLFLQKGRETWI